MKVDYYVLEELFDEIGGGCQGLLGLLRRWVVVDDGLMLDG
jgi:hypothetical protein